VSEQVEISFYEESEAIRNDKSTAKKELLAITKFIPLFYGLHDDQSTTTPEAPMIVMQNMVFRGSSNSPLTHGMDMACVADFKIGCKLFEDSAAKNKKAKMQAYSSATTADAFGVIVSGLKTFDPETSTFLKFPKKYVCFFHNF
jgi:hypothetical protein